MGDARYGMKGWLQMSVQPETLYPQEKEAFYRLLLQQAMALIEGERNPLPNMANISALLAGALPRINWVGFYVCHRKELILGPFQGKTACIRIPEGRGVCGTAAMQQKTQRIQDVHAFPGHIACDEASRSEIVVPIHQRGKVQAVLDIDSPERNRFDEKDQHGLEAIGRVLEAGCDWPLWPEEEG